MVRGTKQENIAFKEHHNRQMGGSLKQNTFIIEHKRWTLHAAWNLTFWDENATKDMVC